MEFKGQIIQRLLRVLTPEEISRLTTSFSNKKKVSLSAIVEAQLAGDDYGLLFEDDETQLSQNKEEVPSDTSNVVQLRQEQPEKVSYQTGKRVLLLMQEYDKAFKKMEKNILGPKRFTKRKLSNENRQTSELIIEQKRKLYHSYSKIKSIEVLSLYQDTSKVDIDKNIDEKGQRKRARKSGVLINKKLA